MKMTLEIDSITEIRQYTELLNTFEIRKDVIKDLENFPYGVGKGGDPCFICGGFGHNPDCEWLEFMNRLKEQWGIK